MLSDIIIIIVSSVVLLLPLVFWYYVCIVSQNISRIRFVGGIILGALISGILFGVNITLPNFFTTLFSSINSDIFSTLTTVGLFFLLFFLIFLGVYYILRLQLSLYVLALYLLLILGFSLISILVLQYFFSGDIEQIRSSYRNILFIGLGSVGAYYIIVALLEESSKLLGGVPNNTSLVSGSFLIVSVALGFSFSENILYTFFFAQNNGISSDLIYLSIIRTIFSVILHTTASILLYIGFKYFTDSKTNLLFILFVALSIGGHAFYDIMIGLGNFLLISLYFIGLYFVISYHFFKKQG